VHQVLSVIAGPLLGEEFVIHDKVEIGRSGELSVQLISSAVSRHHAEVRLASEHTAVLLDLGSRNGTFVRGQRISSHELTSGDTFEIGSSSFRFEVRPGEPPVPNDLHLSLLSGPAEDVTEILRRSHLGERHRPTTVPGATEPAPSPDPTEATAVATGTSREPDDPSG
jgi:hypothetical protein